MSRLLISFAFVGLLIAGAVPTAAADQIPYCGPGEDAQFSPRLSYLEATFSDVMGDPVECSHLDASGMEVQNTTTGIAFYRSDLHLPIFSTGDEYWAIGPAGPMHGVNDGRNIADQVLSSSVTAATATPPAVSSAPVVMNPPTATPEATYETRKGSRTLQQLRDELDAAGYAGPWEPSAMLAAYDRATAPRPTPTPTVNPVVLECESVAGAYPAVQSAAQDAAKASARNDFRSLRSIAATLRGRTYPPRLLPVVNALLRMLDWDAGAAEIRYNWPLLQITAAQSSSGYLLIAAAQADLNRDNGEVGAADVDLQAATRQLATTCP